MGRHVQGREECVSDKVWDRVRFVKGLGNRGKILSFSGEGLVEYW